MQEKAHQKTTDVGYFQSQGRRLLSVPETARLMGISPKTIYNEISKKCFPIRAKRHGRRVLFDERAVLAIVALGVFATIVEKIEKSFKRKKDKSITS